MMKNTEVALRKESVDRNDNGNAVAVSDLVALRKESVDRNCFFHDMYLRLFVALRKESVDRNTSIDNLTQGVFNVALRKESVDRNSVPYRFKTTKTSRSPQGERG